MMNVGNTEVAEIMLARPDIDVNFQDKVRVSLTQFGEF